MLGDTTFMKRSCGLGVMADAGGRKDSTTMENMNREGVHARLHPIATMRGAGAADMYEGAIT